MLHKFMNCVSQSFSTGGNKIPKLRYAEDDITLLGNTGEEITNLLLKVKHNRNKIGFKISTSKTKVMIINEPQEKLLGPKQTDGTEKSLCVREHKFLSSCEKKIRSRMCKTDAFEMYTWSTYYEN